MRPYAHIYIDDRVCFEFALIVLAGQGSEGAIRGAGSIMSPAQGQPSPLFPQGGCHQPYMPL
jgi:hypothetical protein